MKPTALGALFSVFAAAALRGGVSTLISRTRCLIPIDRFRVPPQFGQGRGLGERLKQVQFFKAHRSICGARGDDAVWSATADRRCASHLDSANGLPVSSGAGTEIFAEKLAEKMVATGDHWVMSPF